MQKHPDFIEGCHRQILSISNIELYFRGLHNVVRVDYKSSNNSLKDVNAWITVTIAREACACTFQKWEFKPTTRPSKTKFLKLYVYDQWEVGHWNQPHPMSRRMAKWREKARRNKIFRESESELGSKMMEPHWMVTGRLRSRFRCRNGSRKSFFSDPALMWLINTF